MNKKKGNVISRTFQIAAQGKSALFFSCMASVIGMAAGMLPYLSDYKIANLLKNNADFPSAAI